MLGQESPLEKSFGKWKLDILNLEDHQMRERESFWHSTVISARDQLIQTKWLHRVYFTPVTLVQMRRLSMATCTSCGGSPGTFIHGVGKPNYTVLLG